MVNAAMSTPSAVVCKHTVVIAGESGASTEGANAQVWLWVMVGQFPFGRECS